MVKMYVYLVRVAWGQGISEELLWNGESVDQADELWPHDFEGILSHLVQLAQSPRSDVLPFNQAMCESHHLLDAVQAAYLR